MKTKNTLGNKAKFFALYWGQEVFVKSDAIRKVDWSPMVLTIGLDTIDYCLLKPLSSITDEDAIEFGRVLSKYFASPNGMLKLRDDYFRDLGKIHIKTFLNKGYIINEGCDYIRSKGYALPWMGLSVDDLIEYGWIKLTN